MVVVSPLRASLARAVLPVRGTAVSRRPGKGSTSVQAIFERLGPGAVKSFFWRWQRRLRSPLTWADLRSGYVYELMSRSSTGGRPGVLREAHPRPPGRRPAGVGVADLQSTGHQ